MELSSAQFVDVDGLKIRCLKGPERTGTPLLLTSPWPESLFAFHRVWPRLAEHASVIAVDLPGFGLSGGRADVLCPSGMGDFIPRIMQALRLERVHAVAPDVGTAAFLFAAKSAPSLFESLIVGGGATAVDTAAATLKDLILAPSLAQLEAQDGSTIAMAAIDRMMHSELPREIRDDYAAASSGRRFVEAAAYVRSYPVELVKLRAALEFIATPVLGIWGDNDPIVPPVNAQLLLEGLPRTTAIYLDAGHFAWEEQPDAYATAVLDWVAAGYRHV